LAALCEETAGAAPDFGPADSGRSNEESLCLRGRHNPVGTPGIVGYKLPGRCAGAGKIKESRHETTRS